MIIWNSDLLTEMPEVPKEEKSTYSTCPRSHLHISETKLLPFLQDVPYSIAKVECSSYSLTPGISPGMIVSKLMYKTKAKRTKWKNDKDGTLNDCFAVTSSNYNKRGKGWSELVGSQFVVFHRQRTRGKIAKRQQTDCFPAHAGISSLKGKVHTGRDWVNP